MAQEHLEELLREFLARYTREFDYYDQLSRLVSRRLESALGTAGIRSIVTSRAKSPSRTSDKIRQRYDAKRYATVADIYGDLVDLSGVRVALYFPDQRDQVASIIERLFEQSGERRNYPDARPPNGKRFRGYSASHFRVRIREADLTEAETRYALGVTEIQVASVLMHAWSEVEHDLVYKPLSGELSDRELALLDQLNGLVEAGEIALEQLQQAGDERVSATDRTFTSHYELAAYLLNRAQSVGELRHVDDEGLGRVDLLFDLMRDLGLDTPDSISTQIEQLHGDFEARPIAEQIVDLLVQADEERYRTWEKIRGRNVQPMEKLDQRHSFVSAAPFLEQWVRLERSLRGLAQGDQRAGRPKILISGTSLQRLNIVDASEAQRIDYLRRMRNLLVHGVEIPAPDVIMGATVELRRLADQIEQRLKDRHTELK